MNKSKLISSIALIFAFSIIVFSQSKPNLKGTWTEYRAGGKKVTAYKVKIFQINGVTTISMAGSRVTAIIRGNKITWRNSNASGTIVNNGNRINWADGSFWVKQITSKPKPKTRPSTRPTPRTTPPPQRTTSKKTLPPIDPVPKRVSVEQRCFNMVQGKVAWRKNGSKRWADNNVRSLCAGTKNPSALVACFKSQINQNKNWTTARNYCKRNSPKRTNTGLPVSTNNRINLTGEWTVYFADGKVASVTSTIVQNGRTFTFDTGIGDTKATARISRNTAYFGGSLTGKISDDGKLIRMSNDTIWVKR